MPSFQVFRFPARTTRLSFRHAAVVTLGLGLSAAAPAGALPTSKSDASKDSGCTYSNSGGDLVFVASKACLKDVQQDKTKRQALAKVISRAADSTAAIPGQDLHPLQRLSLHAQMGQANQVQLLGGAGRMTPTPP